MAAPAVTHTVTAPTAAPKPTTPAPTTPAPTTAAPVAPAPAKTVYVAPARVAAPAPAAPAVQTNCGNDVYAGANTSCAFAQNVAAAYPGGMGGTAVVYSPVTGESYTMTYTRDSAGDWVIAAGGNGASVNFKLG